MKKQAYNTNGQQTKKPANGTWLRWVVVVMVLGLMVGDGVVGGRWSNITLAGNEEEVVSTPSELVVEEVAEEPAPAPAPEVTETHEKEEKAPAEVVVAPAPEETAEEAKEENAQDHENNVQDPALALEEGKLAEDEQPAPERTVAIYSNLEDTIGVNETFEMTAELSGFEDVAYTVQWQRNEGFGWEDIGGATGLVLEVPASALDAQYGYRLVVNVEA